MQTTTSSEFISSNVRTSGTGAMEARTFTFVWDPVCTLAGVDMSDSNQDSDLDSNEEIFPVDRPDIALRILFKGSQ